MILCREVLASTDGDEGDENMIMQTPQDNDAAAHVGGPGMVGGWVVDEEASHRFATAVVIRPVTHTHQKVVSPLNCISHFTRVTRVETRDERLFCNKM